MVPALIPMSLSVIIPAFNEERTISSVIEIVRLWGKASEIIVVDDGSTDTSLTAIQQFHDEIEIITYKKNRGKGYAIARGIRTSRGDILMFLDADLVGLTVKDLDNLIKPMLSGYVDMVIGIPNTWGVGKLPIYNQFSGERVVRRVDIDGCIADIRQSGYGLEVLLNHLYQKKTVEKVKLPHVYILRKTDKNSLNHSVNGYIKETSEVMRQVLKNTWKSMKQTPHIRHKYE